MQQRDTWIWKAKYRRRLRGVEPSVLELLQPGQLGVLLPGADALGACGDLGHDCSKGLGLIEVFRGVGRLCLWLGLGLNRNGCKRILPPQERTPIAHR